MDIFLSKFFWGGLLIFWGLGLILEKLFKLNIPFGRFIIAFILIYCGIYIITRSTVKQKKIEVNSSFFSSTTLTSSEGNRQFNVVFGSNVVDISDYTYPEPVEINTIFGSSTVLIAKDRTYSIRANTGLGETILPFEREQYLGSNVYIVGNKESEEKTEIVLNTVFASTHVKFKSEDKRER